jgi:tetratricopeptide (TPR) repeat protein
MGKEDFSKKASGKDAYFSGDFHKSVALFTEAITLRPSDPNLYGLRCTAFNKLKFYELALKDVDKMLELRPYNYKGYLMRGSCLFHLGEFEDAIEAYKHAEQANPDKELGVYVGQALKKINEVQQRR